MSDDRVWRELFAKVGTLAERKVKVGVIQGKGAEDKTEDGAFTMADLAAVHEFGTDDGLIPERKPIRGAFEGEGETLLAEQTTKIAKGILADKIDVPTGLEILGQWGSTRIKRRISEGEITPENAPATIIAKNVRAGQAPDAKTTVLVDTGRLINAYTYEVG